MGRTQNASWIGYELASGRYRVDAELGEGGMGVVYRAWDKNLGTDVVIKVPHASMLQDAEFAARFAREISSLVKLSHPHIVKISDVGEADGLPFAVMQFLPGGSLEDRQRSEPEGEIRPLPPDSLEEWLASVAASLDFVHQQGYIHRDVKPANILFDAHGHAYLSDFGIAKLAAASQVSGGSRTVTGAGLVIGTPEYMAPELIMGQSVDGRVDQYSLAVTVFEILAGRRPFEDATSTAVLVQHSTKEPPDLASLSPNVPVSLAAAIRKGLSKSPNDRFTNCSKFADAVLASFTSASKSGEPRMKCPVCQKVLKLSEKARGKEVVCPSCKTDLWVSDDLRQLSELNTNRNSNAGVSGTRVLGARSAMPEIIPETYRLVRDQSDASVENQPATAPMTQDTMAMGQPSSRTKPIPSPEPPKKGRTEQAKGTRNRRPQVAEQEPPGGNKKWLSIAAGGAAIVLLGITIFVMTGRGTVKITVKGGDDSIQVKVDGDEITVSGLDVPLKLSPGEHGLTVTSPRFETVTKSFKVTRGNTTVVEIELQPIPSSVQSTVVTVVTPETPEQTPIEKPAVYTVELDPPQAVFSVEGDGVAVTGTGRRRTVSVAKPQPDAPLVLVARLDGFQDARRKLQPVPGASEAIVFKLSPTAKSIRETPVPSNPSPRAAFQIQLGSDQEIYQRTVVKLDGSLLGVPNALQNVLIAEVDFGDGGSIEEVSLAPNLTFQLEHSYPAPGEFPVTVVVSDSQNEPVKATATITVKPFYPVPDVDNLDKSRKTIHGIFNKEFADANKTATRIAWSEKLIEKGLETTDDPAGRYVLFDEAALQAIEAPELSLAYRAIDEIAKTFDINPHLRKAELLELTVEKTKFVTYHKKSAEAGLAAFEDALRNDEFAAASDLLKAAKKAAEAVKDLGLVTKIMAASERLVSKNKLWNQFTDARTILEMSKDDPAANYDTGRYLCFLKGQWNSGLPFLAKGPTGREVELAAMDLNKTKTDQDKLAVADGWKALADSADTLFQYQQKRRAAFWYQRAIPQLTGLSRTRAEGVLMQLDAVTGAALDPTTGIPLSSINTNQRISAINLVKKISDATYKGKWTLEGGVVENLADLSCVMLPVEATGSYSLSVELERKSGNQGSIIYLPVGTGAVVLEIGAGGAYAGKNGTPFQGKDQHNLAVSEGNTLAKLGSIRNNQWVKVNVSVTITGKKAKIVATIDKEDIFDWSGDLDTLKLQHGWVTPPKKYQFALTTLRSRVAFRNFEVQGKVRIVR